MAIHYDGIDDVTISEGWCSGGVVTVPPTNPRPEQLTCYCNECNNRNKVCVTDGSCFGEKVVVGRRERYSFRCLDQSVLQANPFLCRQSPGRSGDQTTTVCCNNEDYCNFKLITNPQTSTTTVKPTTPAPTEPPYIKPGTCPAPGGSSVGICIEMCSGDADCTGNKKCCSNGCGHVCVSPEVEPIVKDGVCPAGSGSSRTSVVRCMQVCESDQDCPGRKKCCQIGCDVICVDPVPDVPAEPEYEVCWSGNMCNQCDRDWVGSINGLDVCCPQCRQSGLRVIAGNCTCAKDWSPDDDGEDGDGDNDDSRITEHSWTRRTFLYDDKYNGCHGDQYVKLSGYDVGRYVGVILCSSRRYKIFLSDDLDGVFLNVADSSGHGQDHCEFLGGTEESNNIDNDFWDSPLTRGYYRSQWGQSPRLASIGGGTGSTWTGKFYVRWIECGLTIP
ncbi:uncharacterized protein [Ptychodera flava]|uniref:uncharacterized protein n=1 Tax=Ptychodera flava TaxID=63121 RepID=UPI00396A4076